MNRRALECGLSGGGTRHLQNETKRESSHLFRHLRVPEDRRLDGGLAKGGDLTVPIPGGVLKKLKEIIV